MCFARARSVIASNARSHMKLSSTTYVQHLAPPASNTYKDCFREGSLKEVCGSQDPSSSEYPRQTACHGMLGIFHGRPLTFNNSAISSVSSLIGSPSDRHLRVNPKRKRQLSVQASKAKGNYSKTTKKAATPEKVRGTLCCSGTLQPSGYQSYVFCSLLKFQHTSNLLLGLTQKVTSQSGFNRNW